jgi:FSR family fosmidomycin resistance protein-like MFS transporter
VLSTGHFVHDCYTAFFAPMLPLLIERFALSLTFAGSLTFFLQIPSLLNPVIGYLDDRYNLKKVLALAPAVTGTLMTVLGIAPDLFSLCVLLLVVGVSVATFHSTAPAMIGRISGEFVGRGMSFFMAGGELGRTVGPLLFVWAVSSWTLEGLYQIAVFGWLASLLLFLQVRQTRRPHSGPPKLRSLLRVASRLFLPVFVILIGRSFLISSMAVFLPTLMMREGSSLLVAAGALSLYEVAGVLGALASGTLSDRYGRRPLLVAALAVSSAMIFLLLKAQGWVVIPALLLLGFAALSMQPVMLAVIQDQLSDQRAVANGLYLAMSFVMRPFAAVVIGILGDWLSLRHAFLVTACVALVSLIAVRWLPEKRTR